MTEKLTQRLRFFLLRQLHGVSMETFQFTVRVHEHMQDEAQDALDNLAWIRAAYLRWKTCPPEESKEASIHLHAVLTAQLKGTPLCPPSTATIPPASSKPSTLETPAPAKPAA